MHEKVDGMEIGQHALVSHLLKGAFNSQPPLPCYDAMWDVKTVTTYLSGMRKNESLSLQAFTQKLVMLFSLTRPSWVADFAQLNLHIANSSRRGCVLQHQDWPSSPDQEKLYRSFCFKLSLMI